MSAETTPVSPTANLWREFLICLGTMTFFATGGGSYLLLIVGYMEKRGLPVTEMGAVMSLLSIVEGVVCLLIGHFYKGKSTRRILTIGFVLNGLSALILSFQPLGVPVWVSAMFCGAGFGVVTVIMYVAALQRRPRKLNLGMAVGLYTAVIAAGNGIGALISGWLTDERGFTVSFLFVVGCYTVGFMGLLLLSRKPLPHPVAQDTQAAQVGGTAAKRSVWMLALLSAFTLASIGMVFDILFPVYTLRAGMSFTLVGSLTGIKMVLAAIVRPFSGALMSRLNPLRLNNSTLVGFGLSTMLIPVAGMGLGLTAVIGLLGVTFGSVRTTSATLVVKDEYDPQVTSRRISYYNTSLTVGQTVSPWLIGVIADYMEVTTALVVVPLIFLGIYMIGSILMPGLAARLEPREARTIPL